MLSGGGLVSVAVLTRNEACRLPRCLAAIPEGYPVVVVDSGSSDGTVDIARGLGARVMVNPWPGFAAQRNFCLDACGIDTSWVLFVDADEIFPAEFYRWLEETLPGAGAAAFDAVMVPSHLVFKGQVLRYAPGYPVVHPRLVRSRGVRFVTNHTGHGEAVAAGARLAGCPVAYLHYFYDGDLAAWLHKHIALAELETRPVDPRGRHLTGRGRISHRVGGGAVRIPLRFLYHYLLRGGFRDGRAGFQYAAMYTWFEVTKWVLRTQADHAP